MKSLCDKGGYCEGDEGRGEERSTRIARERKVEVSKDNLSSLDKWQSLAAPLSITRTLGKPMCVACLLFVPFIFFRRSEDSCCDKETRA